jgi:solute carrier family 25 phosphate transporter 23/24/25/41
MPTYSDRAKRGGSGSPAVADKLTPEEAESLKAMYDEELLGHCGGHVSGVHPSPVGWKEFKEYAEAKEVGELGVFQAATFLNWLFVLELWSIFHDELDLDGNGHLDAQELTLALNKAGTLAI